MQFDPSDLVSLIGGLFGGGVTGSIVAGIAGYFFARLTGKKPQPRTDSRVQRMAFREESRGKGRIANLLSAIGNNDRAAVGKWVEREQAMHEAIPEALANETDRVELLEHIGKIEGVDLVKLIDAAKKAATIVLVALVLSVAAAGSASAAELVPACQCGPACDCGPACACGQVQSGRVGFWHRGPARRSAVKVGRFVLRPFRGR